jgi:hypothetical protein
VILAAETFRNAAPQIDVHTIDRPVGLDLAIRRRIVDRDPQRRVLSHGETGEDEEKEGGREGPARKAGWPKSLEKTAASLIKRM